MEREIANWFDEFCAHVRLPNDAVSAMIAAADEALALLPAHRSLSEPEKLSERLGKQENGYAILLAFAVLRARETRDTGIPEELFWATMEDIAVWCGNCREKTGAPGLENLWWIAHHLRGELIRIGRLQFQPTSELPPAWVSAEAMASAGLRAGERVVAVHIPQGSPLLYEDCLESLRRAENYFENFRFFTCESWLLYPENRLFMEKDCNILRFASLFRVIGSTPDPHQMIERIFNRWNDPQGDPAEYPEDTSLRRAAKAHLLSGGRAGEGFGLRRKGAEP